MARASLSLEPCQVDRPRLHHPSTLPQWPDVDPHPPPPAQPDEWLRLKEALASTTPGGHRLREIPLGLLVCITESRDPGKSTLVHDVLCQRRRLRSRVLEASSDPASLQSYPGNGSSTASCAVDPDPIAASFQSVTCIQAFISSWVFAASEAQHAATPQGGLSTTAHPRRPLRCLRQRRLRDRRNAVPGRRRVAPCEECNGTRYRPAPSKSKYKGENIHEVLAMTVKALAVPRRRNPRGNARCSKRSVSATFASANHDHRAPGGEAQRVKRRILRKVDTVRRLDRSERTTTARKPRRYSTSSTRPTTGLHFGNVEQLLAAFPWMIDASGLAEIVIEHNLDVIRSPTG